MRAKVLGQRVIALVLQTRCADVKPLWESEREKARYSLEYVKSSDAKASKCRLNFLRKCAFFSRYYIYVQLFHLNCIEKDLYIAIKVKLLEI